MKLIGILFIALVLVCTVWIAEAVNRTEIEDTASIRRIIEQVRRVDHLHPLLEAAYPVAILRDDSLYVYDAPGNDRRYRFVIAAQSPIPVRGTTIRASFPLAFYGNKAAVVVTPDVLDEDDAVITLCHEFIHCGQWHGGEQKIKAALDVYHSPDLSDDPMGEINYPFPYDNSAFINSYSRFLKALQNRDRTAVRQSRLALKKHLGKNDYEFMVFMEWKEGLARFIENQVSRQLGMKESDYGSDKPFNRVTFYAGGAAYIRYLERENPGISENITGLFDRMYNNP